MSSVHGIPRSLDLWRDRLRLDARYCNDGSCFGIEKEPIMHHSYQKWDARDRKKFCSCCKSLEAYIFDMARSPLFEDWICCCFYCNKEIKSLEDCFRGQDYSLVEARGSGAARSMQKWP
jgi:hypothetical protein